MKNRENQILHFIFELNGNDPNLIGIVKELKRVDNALVAFGQFAYSYAKTISF